jgi:hypothetical protein
VNPIVVAARGKGPVAAARRATIIGRRYGLTPGQMDASIGRFVDVLRRFDSPATFPLTAAPLSRRSGVIDKYRNDAEFAVHGLYHVDHTKLSGDEQEAQLRRARSLFEERGLDPVGFRAPYLRYNAETIAAVRAAGFSYDASQAVAWDVEGDPEPYRLAREFSGARAWSATPSLPQLDDGLVRLPYCLPDDEALVDRLQVPPGGPMASHWLRMLEDTHRREELFTLAIHPERIDHCREALVAVIERARDLRPDVWIARLQEIARWWTSRAAASVVVEGQDDLIRVRLAGDKRLRFVVRGVDIEGAAGWYGDEALVQAAELVVPARPRPLIGITPRTSSRVGTFLQEHGYLSEPADPSAGHQPIVVDLPVFDSAEQVALLRRIDASWEPLIRLARWPLGARSALAVTGDIDALTIWDYALRFLGR